MKFVFALAALSVGSMGYALDLPFGLGRKLNKVTPCDDPRIEGCKNLRLRVRSEAQVSVSMEATYSAWDTRRGCGFFFMGDNFIGKSLTLHVPPRATPGGELQFDAFVGNNVRNSCKPGFSGGVLLFTQSGKTVVLPISRFENRPGAVDLSQTPMLILRGGAFWTPSGSKVESVYLPTFAAGQVYLDALLSVQLIEN